MVLGDAVKLTVTGDTVTVALAVAVPPGPWAVAVNVVVWLIDPVLVVPACGVTEPMPLMVSEVALELDQLRTELPFAETVAGVAESWTVGATWFTVTVVLAVAVPFAPVAVMVNVVVCCGVTAACPVSGMLVTSSCGIAGEMETEVAFVLDQEMVLNCPAVIVAGED